MPTYEYECAKCAKIFEVFQRITDKPLSKCPTCKSKVKRLIGTGSGVIFKGSGFYATDYRSEGYKSAAKAEHRAAAPKSEPAAKDSKPAKTGTKDS